MSNAKLKERIAALEAENAELKRHTPNDWKQTLYELNVLRDCLIVIMSASGMRFQLFGADPLVKARQTLRLRWGPARRVLTPEERAVAIEQACLAIVAAKKARAAQAGIILAPEASASLEVVSDEERHQAYRSVLTSIVLYLEPRAPGETGHVLPADVPAAPAALGVVAGGKRKASAPSSAPLLSPAELEGAIADVGAVAASGLHVGDVAFGELPDIRLTSFGVAGEAKKALSTAAQALRTAGLGDVAGELEAAGAELGRALASGGPQELADAAKKISAIAERLSANPRAEAELAAELAASAAVEVQSAAEMRLGEAGGAIVSVTYECRDCGYKAADVADCERHEKECPGPTPGPHRCPRHCCDRAGEYNGFGSDGPVAFVCPAHCSCHD